MGFNNSSQVEFDLSAQWGFVPIFQLSCSLSAFGANLLTLFIFGTVRSLQTPFNVYLMFLLTFNIINAVVVCPFDTLAVLYPHWIFGANMCSAYLYICWMTQAVIPHTHLLISLNRVWAVTAPHHYRDHISKRLSMWSCVVIFAYVNAMLLPLMILDVVKYRTNELANGCEVNVLAAGNLGAAVQYAVYDLPIILVIVLYPIIAVQVLRSWVAQKRIIHHGE